MKLIIRENQRGFLFKNGALCGLLGPGKYFVLKKAADKPTSVYTGPFGRTIEVVSARGLLTSTLADQRTLITSADVLKEVAVYRVERGELGFHFVDGTFCGTYNAGMVAFWNVYGENSFLKADVTTPDVAGDFPREIFPALKRELYAEHVTDARMHSLLFIDGKFEKVLPAGKHYFWKNGRSIEVRTVPACLTEEAIVGQEILTADKVAVRINCITEYRITDPVRAVTAVSDYAASLHTAAQIALREFVGKYRLDELLSMREEIAEYLLGRLQKRGEELALDVRSAAVKDIILPGEIRDIMNTVLVAEKRAQANVITRREEVASTRSLLNTAKLMEENATLYKLKELEYIERICEHVQSLSIGGDDILAQLTAALGGRREA